MTKFTKVESLSELINDFAQACAHYAYGMSNKISSAGNTFKDTKNLFIRDILNLLDTYMNKEDVLRDAIDEYTKLSKDRAKEIVSQALGRLQTAIDKEWEKRIEKRFEMMMQKLESKMQAQFDITLSKHIKKNLSKTGGEDAYPPKGHLGLL